MATTTTAVKPEAWTPTDTFSMRLHMLRYELGLTAEDLATRCGYRPSTWHTWEKGARPRGLDEIVARISEVTGVDRDWLMWGSRNRCFGALVLEEPSGGPPTEPDRLRRPDSTEGESGGVGDPSVGADQ